MPGKDINQLQLMNKIKGGLYGVAIGDAMGGTTEFMSPEEIRTKYGYVTEITGGGVWRLAPGEVTDDTAMTLCVAEGILEEPEDPIEAIGRRFLGWSASRPKDIGNIIRRVFDNYEGNWMQAAFLTHEELYGKSAGNGALMRCLPVALAYEDTVKMEHVSHLQSKMTHYDEESSEACRLYNRIAARLLQGGELKDSILAEIRGTKYETSAASGQPECEPSGYVADTLQWVLHHLLHSTSFSEAVQKAVNQGGDSDTIASITGGLAGLAIGYDELPERYTQVIQIRGRLDYAAEGLYRLRCGTASQGVV
jgi:ADP-ribosyl-[dinitrogen reductase] hydrolase